MEDARASHIFPKRQHTLFSLGISHRRPFEKISYAIGIPQAPNRDNPHGVVSFPISLLYPRQAATDRLKLFAKIELSVLQ